MRDNPLYCLLICLLCVFTLGALIGVVMEAGERDGICKW